MSDTYDHVIFVGRRSLEMAIRRLPRRERDGDLQLSLQCTKACYEQVYGPITGTWEFYTFAWPAHVGFLPSSSIVRFFSERTAALGARNQRLMVVINGWNGLTSDLNSFSALFREHASRITIRVFASHPRSFFQVNVGQMFELFDGKIIISPFLEGRHPAWLDEETLELMNQMETQLEYSTALFYRYFLTHGGWQLN